MLTAKELCERVKKDRGCANIPCGECPHLEQKRSVGSCGPGLRITGSHDWSDESIRLYVQYVSGAKQALNIPKRPTVGDRVRIITDKAGQDYKGKCGVIIRDDHDSHPYRVKIDGTQDPNAPRWFDLSDIQLEKGKLFITESKASRRREILGRLSIE